MGDFSGNNKRIAKNTLMLYLRSLFVMAVALFTTKVTLQVLGVDNYGIYNIIGGTITMFSLISNSLISGTQRFITYALGTKNKEHLKNVFDSCVSLHIVVAIAIIPILEVLGLVTLYKYLNIPSDRLDAAFWVLQCSIFSLSFSILQVPYNALIIAHERMSAYAYISVIEVVFKLFIVWALIIYPGDKLICYAFLILGVTTLIRLIYVKYSERHFEEARKIKFRVKGSIFKDMLGFSGWNILGNGSLLLRNQGIDMLLNVYFGVAINTAKGLANQIQNAISQFVSNFQSAVNPQLVKSIASGDFDRNHELVVAGSRYSFYLMTLFSVPIILNAQGILSLWLTDVPDWTSDFLIFTLIYCLFDSLSRLLIQSILAYGKIKYYQIIVGGTKLLAVPITLAILVCGGSPLTGIYVNIGLEIICLAERLYFNRKYTSLNVKRYICSVIFKCWLIFALAYSCSLASQLIIQNVFGSVIISGITTLTLIYILGINKKERNYFKNIVLLKIRKNAA